MIVISGIAEIRADRIAEATAAGSKVAAASRDEPGCADYRFAIDIDNPLKIHLFEQWENQAALDAHFGMPHFAEFSGQLGAFLAAPPKFTRYEVSSAGPLFGE